MLLLYLYNKKEDSYFNRRNFTSSDIKKIINKEFVKDYNNKLSIIKNNRINIVGNNNSNMINMSNHNNPFIYNNLPYILMQKQCI